MAVVAIDRIDAKITNRRMEDDIKSMIRTFLIFAAFSGTAANADEFDNVNRQDVYP